MADLRDELAAVQRKVVSAAAIQRAVALFAPVWDLLLVPERFRILHLLLESVGYDGSTGRAPDASTQGVTLSIPTHLAEPSHALILREGPKPTWPHSARPQ